MLKTEAKQLSLYSILYNKIPENHILKSIKSVISFEFINEVLESSYCKGFGRPAKEPQMMLKILMLQYLYNLSDERVIQETQVNLAYMWFIGINPDDELPHPSLLAKFRTMRLKNITLDEIIMEVVRQCIEKNIISTENGIAIDTTHIEANTVKKVPERIMKHLSEKIFKSMDKTDYEIPNYKEIQDPKEAKQVMKNYLEQVINEATPEASEAVKEAKEVLNSDLFIEQKGIRSLVDKDARVGRKTKIQSFYGYKVEFEQTTSEGIITAVKVENGAYVDGSDFQQLQDITKKSGINIKAVYGDKAYFRADILNLLKEDGIENYIPVSASSYKIDEELFSYNKDSDQWLCINGNETIKKQEKTVEKRGKKFRQFIYTFEKECCRSCPHRNKCIGKSKNIAKKMHISENAPSFYEYSQRAKTEEFLEEYKKRAKIEPKNGEMKRFHGLARARGYGLISVSTQTKLTVLAVNLKRIAKLVSPLNGAFYVILSCFYFNMIFLQINGKPIMKDALKAV